MKGLLSRSRSADMESGQWAGCLVLLCLKEKLGLLCSVSEFKEVDDMLFERFPVIKNEQN